MLILTPLLEIVLIFNGNILLVPIFPTSALPIDPLDCPRFSWATPGNPSYLMAPWLLARPLNLSQLYSDKKLWY